jgi:hypothetical protein
MYIIYVFLIRAYLRIFITHLRIFEIHVYIFLIHVYIFQIHINIFQQNKYATAARLENYKVRPVMSTNFPSARQQIQVGTVLSRPKTQLRHYLNST